MFQNRFFKFKILNKYIDGEIYLVAKSTADSENLKNNNLCKTDGYPCKYVKALKNASWFFEAKILW